MKRFALLFAAAGTLLLGHHAKAQTTDFNVGIVGAMSGSFVGPTKDTIDGFNAWVKVHGLPGKTIKQTIVDDETNPVTAQNVFRKLATDPKIQLVMMYSNSNAGLAIKPFASELKVPIICGGGADDLGVPADPWLFKIAPSTKDNMTALAVWAEKSKHLKIAHIYGTDAFGQLEHKNLTEVGPQHGLTIVDSESASIDNTTFSNEITKLRASKPDVIYTSLSGRAFLIFFKQYKQMNIDIPLAAAGAGVSQPFFDGIGGADKADGLYANAQLGTYGDMAGGVTAKMVAELRGVLGKPPSFFNTFGWDSGVILADAVARSDGTREGLRAALDNTKELPAINGPVNYKPADHTGQDYRALLMGKLKGGVYTPALQQ